MFSSRPGEVWDEVYFSGGVFVSSILPDRDTRSASVDTPNNLMSSALPFGGGLEGAERG